MDLGLKDRVAIVTGGSAGIGLAVVEELLENGANVCVVARKEARLLASVRRLQVTSERVLAIVADVADPLSAVSIVDQTISKFGHLDILVNNAGRGQAGGLMSSSEDDWEDMTAVKLTAMRMLCKAAIPAMRARQWGRIVNMSSIGGIYPDPKRLISHVLSAAINNITKSIALEVASDGILVNAIGIGAIATENWVANMIPALRRTRPDCADLSDEQILVKVGAERTPIGRVGDPREIAALAVFLASDRNGFITGDTIEASGGADHLM
jgi:3-oxoacyl-[acyl-carrier protein] reductase